MKIVEKNSDKNYCFYDIENGECFCFNNEYYIKTGRIETPIGNEQYNLCVRLKDGKISFFNDESHVLKINAKIIIE